MLMILGFEISSKNAAMASFVSLGVSKDLFALKPKDLQKTF
jgi:hypothetical protein